ncbi:ribosomal protection-like ABC-F family protein [Desulfovibrio psychrotolerans]|uniref:Lsa family ABC-F type ribosomal protection protein n=1 Tax=Desulfovibrio psychrotolerans TaxID=415242 RepID=A0A7J0BSG9_9BACT|nr:ABC-F type ribosomal protection protein [Desulfovibrio psychrotolerans]GFM36666.1 Lsa family ABC-F type ribosomal protection protein [Desulfovibrio psychrotolerans]
MALINVSHLTFAYDNGQTIFNNVSLQLDTNWKLGLIGRNGRGKTTFLKLLCGTYPFRGSIHTPVAMQYFPFAMPDPAMTGKEIARAICAGPEDWRLEREASLLALAPETLSRPYATLSGGEATKLLLAILFLNEHSFPLIDEPTNHLDSKARATVATYLKAKKGFILVSHDRALLDSCTDHVLSINRTDIELHRGNFSSWQDNRQRRDRQEFAENQRLEKEIARLEQSARRSTEWSHRAEKGKYTSGHVDRFLDRGFIGHKAAKMMQRAKSVESRHTKAAQDKAELLHNLEHDAPLAMRPLTFHSKRLVECRELCAGYGNTSVLRNISFSVMSGDRLALCGSNGSGKTTLLSLLTGKGSPGSGVLHLPKGLRVSYVPQNTSFLKGSLKQLSQERGIEESLLRAVLHRLGFERRHFETDMGGYSAGQKKKVLLAASLCEEAHLYVWDEPLNYVDVLSRMQIENLILHYRPSMILVEHDRMFLERVATGILDLDTACSVALTLP